MSMLQDCAIFLLTEPSNCLSSSEVITDNRCVTNMKQTWISNSYYDIVLWQTVYTSWFAHLQAALTQTMTWDVITHKILINKFRNLASFYLYISPNKLWPWKMSEFCYLPKHSEFVCFIVKVCLLMPCNACSLTEKHIFMPQALDWHCSYSLVFLLLTLH